MQSIYLKNNPIKFHSNPISNDGALCFFEEVAPTRRRATTRTTTTRMSSDMKSVHDPKIDLVRIQIA